MAEEIKNTTNEENSAPSKDAKAEKSKKKSDKPSLGSRIKTFFRSYKSEIRKITWESPKEVFRNTLLVIVCMVIVAALIALLDFLFQHALSGLTTLIK